MPKSRNESFCFRTPYFTVSVSNKRTDSVETFRNKHWYNQGNHTAPALLRRKFKTRLSHPPDNAGTAPALLLFGCGAWIWTKDLQVMSLTSYRAAPPRNAIKLPTLENFLSLLSIDFLEWYPGQLRCFIECASFRREFLHENRIF